MTDDMTRQQDTKTAQTSASREPAASNAQCNKKPSNYLQPNTVNVKRNQSSKSSHIIMLIHKKANIIASVIFISNSSNSMRVQHCCQTKTIRKSS